MARATSCRSSVLSSRCTVAGLLLCAFVLHTAHASPHVRHTSRGTRGMASTPGVATVPLSGNVMPLGVYWFNLTVANQSFPVTMDTGSNDVLLPMAGCLGCKPGTTAYTPGATSRPVACGNVSGLTCAKCVAGQCHFQNVYGTCDLANPAQPCYASGPVFTDDASVGGLSARITLGAIHNQTDNFQQLQLVDGIVGLLGASGSWQEPTLMASLVAHGSVAANTFGFCLARTPEVQSGACSGARAGMLTLGGVNKRFMGGAAASTPDVGTGAFFQVTVTDVDVGGVSAAAHGKGPVAPGLSGRVQLQAKPALPRKAIMDSGTNILLLVRHVCHCSSRALVGSLTFVSGAAHAHAHAHAAAPYLHHVSGRTGQLMHHRHAPCGRLCVTTAR